MPDVVDREKKELALATLLRRALKSQRERLIAAMGNPPDVKNIPDRLWDEIRDDIAKRTGATLALIFLMGTETLMTAMDYEVDADAAGDAARRYGERRAKKLAQLTVDTMRGRLKDTAAALRRQARDADDYKPPKLEYDSDGGPLPRPPAPRRPTVEDIEEELDRAIRESSRRSGEAGGITETTAANSAGERHFEKSVARDGGIMQAVWRTAGDDAVCPICAPLDWTNEPDWPDDMEDGPPAHVGCRCWVEYHWVSRPGDLPGGPNPRYSSQKTLALDTGVYKAWDESKVKRDNEGQFANEGGGAAVHTTSDFTDLNYSGRGNDFTKKEVERLRKESEAEDYPDVDFDNFKEQKITNEQRQAAARVHLITALDAMHNVPISQKRNYRTAFVIENNKVAAGGLMRRTGDKEATILQVGSLTPGGGTAVMERLLKEAKQWGVKTVKLEATPWATGFYEKHGFRVLPDQDDFDNFMELDLSKSASVAKAFDPNQPRGDDGRWIDGADIETAKTDPAMAASLRSRTTNVRERQKLDYALEGGGDVKPGPRVLLKEKVDTPTAVVPPSLPPEEKKPWGKLDEAAARASAEARHKPKPEPPPTPEVPKHYPRALPLEEVKKQYVGLVEKIRGKANDVSGGLRAEASRVGRIAKEIPVEQHTEKQAAFKQGRLIADKIDEAEFDAMTMRQLPDAIDKEGYLQARERMRAHKAKWDEETEAFNDWVVASGVRPKASAPYYYHELTYSSLHSSFETDTAKVVKDLSERYDGVTPEIVVKVKEFYEKGAPSRRDIDWAADTAARAAYYGEPAEIRDHGDYALGKASEILPPKVRQGGADPATREFMANARVALNVKDKTIKRILKSGEVQNMFQAGGKGKGGHGPGRAELYYNHRLEGEEKSFGISKRETDHSKRPVYGYLEHGDRLSSTGGDIGDQYGAHQIILKPHVKERTTYTLGDSLDHAMITGRFVGSVSNPPAHSIKQDVKDYGGNAPITVFPGKVSSEWKYKIGADHEIKPPYMEAQIYGGVKLEDIAEIRLANDIPLTKKRQKELEGLGIKITRTPPAPRRTFYAPPSSDWDAAFKDD